MATSLRYPKGQPFFDNNGALLALGTITYSRAGTSTLLNIYSDAAGATALPNPITLNSAGRAVDGSSTAVAIYLKELGFDYKEVIANSSGTVLYTDDNIPEPVDPLAGITDTAKPRIQYATDTAVSVTLTADLLGSGRLASSGSNSITYAPIAASTAGNGNGFLIKKTSASNTVTFDPDGTDTVDGAATFAWTQDDRAYWFISDGANWHVSVAYLSQVNIADGGTGATTATGARTNLGAVLADAVFPGALVAIIEDQKAQNTAGGNFASAADRTRVLNTLVYNRNTAVSLAGGTTGIGGTATQFVLPAGSWEIIWSAPAYKVDQHQSFLFNVTGAAEVKRGTSSFSLSSAENSVSRSIGATQVTIAVPTTYEIRHRCSTTSGTGFGVVANFGTEVYTEVIIKAA